MHCAHGLRSSIRSINQYSIYMECALNNILHMPSWYLLKSRYLSRRVTAHKPTQLSLQCNICSYISDLPPTCFFVHTWLIMVIEIVAISLPVCLSYSAMVCLMCSSLFSSKPICLQHVTICEYTTSCTLHMEPYGSGCVVKVHMIDL